MKSLIVLMLTIGLVLFESFAANTPSYPILLITHPQDFNAYIGEILKTEGINEFQIGSLSDSEIDLDYLNCFDIVIMGEIPLTKAQINMITLYVDGGGNLITLRPDKRLASLFGLTDATGCIENGYFSIDAGTDIGDGLPSKALQLHCSADKYALNGAEKIATLYTDPSTPTGYPGTTFHNHGSGHTIAFTYNLSSNIVYTRQGNPQSAGLEKDGIDGLRAMDMFNDGWVDISKNTLNQADEQMRLLSRCIEKMSTYKKPLPRFWYFPEMLKCLVTLTNDGEHSGEADFEAQFGDIESRGARMSLYILDTTRVSAASAEAWDRRGHEISGHPDDTDEAANPRWNGMKNAITRMKRTMGSRYGITMRTVVNHWFIWCGMDADGKRDFGAQASLEEDQGLEMDVNYAHYDNHSNRGHFLGPLGTDQGNFTGSGLAMKFADVSGEILNVYQLLNNVYDQQYMENGDTTGFYNCFKGLMDRSLNDEVYSCICIKAHTDEYRFSKKPLMKMLDYSNDNKIPVWTAGQLLDFLKVKDQATFSSIRWSNHRLSFQINSSLNHGSGLTFMVPAICGGRKIKSINTDNSDLIYKIQSIKGHEYAMATVKSGLTSQLVVTF